MLDKIMTIVCIVILVWLIVSAVQVGFINMNFNAIHIYPKWNAMYLLYLLLTR